MFKGSACDGFAVAAYVRVSSAGQEAQGASLPDQARRIQEWCDRRQMVLLAVFMDAQSGESIDARPGFLDAIDYTICGEHGCTGLVVFNFDRYAREVGAPEVVRKELAKAGKGLYSVEENFDLNDKYGIFSFQVRMAVAELVRKQIVDLMWERRMAKVQRGGWIGHMPAYGFRAERGELVPDPQEQRLVATAYRLRARGWSYRRIANYFTAWYQKDPSRYGGPRWTKPSKKPRATPYRKNFKLSFNVMTVWVILNREASREQARRQWERQQEKKRQAIMPLRRRFSQQEAGRA